MAITNLEKITAYEILEITHGPGGGANANQAHIHTGFGITTSLSDMDKLRDAVDVYLDNLSTDVETRARSIIEAWDALGFRTQKLIGGSVGDTSGIEEDPEATRDLLRKRLHSIVPVIHIQESIKMRQGPSGSGSVTFAR